MTCSDCAISLGKKIPLPEKSKAIILALCVSFRIRASSRFENNLIFGR